MTQEGGHEMENHTAGEIQAELVDECEDNSVETEPKAGEMVACSRCGTMFPRSWLLTVTPICQDCYREETD